MGNYVPQVTSEFMLPVAAEPEKIQLEGDWSGHNIGGTGSFDLVNTRFNEISEASDSMLAALNGYMDTFSTVIQALELPVLTHEALVIPDLSKDVPSPPSMSGSIDLAFLDFTTPSPSLQVLPTIDTSDLQPESPPDAISSSISWVEQTYSSPLASALISRLSTDLASGATGLNATVEQEIFNRALARQDLEYDRAQQEAEQYFASRGFSLPSGAMSGKLQELANDRTRNVLELNGKILITQADLAQKNSQFVLGLTKDLEALLHDTYNKTSDRSLDYAKAVAANAISVYSESIKGYIAKSEAAKNYIEAQIETLKATVEYNKSLLASYTSEIEAYTASIASKASKNKAITDVFSSEVSAYSASVKAITDQQNSAAVEWGLRVKLVESELAKDLGVLDAEVKAYGAEYGLRERVAEALANVSAQALASMYGAVNASAGISNSFSSGNSESWSHTESRSDSYTHGESISVNVGETSALHNTLNESHTYAE